MILHARCGQGLHDLFSTLLLLCPVGYFLEVTDHRIKFYLLKPERKKEQTDFIPSVESDPVGCAMRIIVRIVFFSPLRMTG